MSLSTRASLACPKTAPHALFRLAGLGLLILPITIVFGFEWPRLSPAELSDNQPRVESDAPAEVLEWKVDVDDNRPIEQNLVFLNVPDAYLAETLRTTTEYVRYKIFVPEEAGSVTRISHGGGVLHVRLTLPNGKVQEFGDRELQSTTVARFANRASFWGRLTSAETDAKKGFLAVPGVERGSILEVHIERDWEIPGLLTIVPLQLPKVPVRRAEVTWHINTATNLLSHNLFVLNPQGGKVIADSDPMTPRFVATNLTSIGDEPAMGPQSDYVTRLLLSYERLHETMKERSHEVPIPGLIEAKLGPWALYSTKMNWLERDRGFATPRVKKLAAEIVVGKTDDLAKAAAIHAYVRLEYQKFLRRAIAKTAIHEDPESLDDVLDWAKKPGLSVIDEEFTYLALALLHSAGLEAHLLLMPDRQFMRFNPKLVASAFLNARAIAVRIAGDWRFMKPANAAPLPFGLLPWQNEGQPALLALDHLQQFVPVPLTPATRSVITNTGDFAVDSGGTLTGQCQRSLTGQTAVSMRKKLLEADPARRRRIIRDAMPFDDRIVALTEPTCRGFDDPEQPLVLSAKISWPGYATRTKNRLIVRSVPLHAEEVSPLSASVRRYPVSFAYCKQEIDRITIAVPAGFTPEFPTKPPANNGDALSLEVELGYDAPRHTLHMTRTFTCNITDAPTKAYPALKEWYENAVQIDRHHVIFHGADIPIPAFAMNAADTSDQSETAPEEVDSSDNFDSGSEAHFTH